MAAGPFPGARGRGGAARLAACPLNHARASHRRLRRRGVVYCNSWRRARQRTPNEFKLPKEVTAETNSSQGRKGFVRGARSCRRDGGAPPGCSALEFALPSAAFPALQNHPELRAFNPAKKLKPRFFFSAEVWVPSYGAFPHPCPRPPLSPSAPFGRSLPTGRLSARPLPLGPRGTLDSLFPGSGSTMRSCFSGRWPARPPSPPGARVPSHFFPSAAASEFVFKKSETNEAERFPATRPAPSILASPRRPPLLVLPPGLSLSPPHPLFCPRLVLEGQRMAGRRGENRAAAAELRLGPLRELPPGALSITSGGEAVRMEAGARRIGAVLLTAQFSPPNDASAAFLHVSKPSLALMVSAPVPAFLPPRILLLAVAWGPGELGSREVAARRLFASILQNR